MQHAAHRWAVTGRGTKHPVLALQAQLGQNHPCLCRQLCLLRTAQLPQGSQWTFRACYGPGDTLQADFIIQ